MKRGVLFFLIFLAVNTIKVKSQTANHDEIIRVARNFYYERINRLRPVSYGDISIENLTLQSYKGMDVFYIVRMKPAGFVIVPAVKKVLPVLAYSFDAVTGENNMPPQFIAWIEQYKKQIHYAVTVNNKASQQTKEEWQRLLNGDIAVPEYLQKGKDIEPLLISTWNQGNYYNQLCPADPAGPAGHCYTGCVATAMGQLCYYFRWPETGTGAYSYQHPDYGTISADFGATNYDWEGMTNNLSEPCFDVAQLLFHLGVSVDMDYGPDGSGMWNHKAAWSLRTYFKYSPQTEYLFRDSTNLNWDSVVIAHLDNKIPMYYAGWSEPNVSGHAFICDGYQNGDYFHFNWGWGGAWDGYFYLDELTPGGTNFNLAQELIINCFPDTINYSYPPPPSTFDTLTTTTGSIDDGSGPVFNYGNNVNSAWLINPQSVQDSITAIKISFDRMNTEEFNDIVTVYDGESQEAPVLGTFSGTEIPQEIISTGNKVLITFSTNSSVTYRGWFLHYSCIKPVYCSGITNLTDLQGTFDDGSGDFFYHNGTSCMWHINPAGANKITIWFEQFETEENIDEVKIVNGDNNDILAVYSGIYTQGNMPDTVIVPSGNAYVIFSTNQTVTYQGWTAGYLALTTDEKELTVKEPVITVFPNPATESITVSFDNAEAQDILISLFSIDGKVAKDKYIINIQEETKISIPLEGIPKGVYFLKVQGETFSSTKKVVKK